MGKADAMTHIEFRTKHKKLIWDSSLIAGVDYEPYNEEEVEKGDEEDDNEDDDCDPTKIKSMTIFLSHMTQMRRMKAFQSMIHPPWHPNLNLIMKMRSMKMNPIKLKVPTKTKSKALERWLEDWTT